MSDADRGGAGIAVVPIAAKDNGQPDGRAPIASGLATAVAIEPAGSISSGGGERAEAAQHLDMCRERGQGLDQVRLVVAALEVDEEHVPPETLAAGP